MGTKFNKPSTAAIPHRGVLLVHGFIREIHSTSPDPGIDDICRLCCAYYTVPRFIFMYDHNAFHALNVTSPNHPTLNKKSIETNDQSTSWNQPFDLCCYLPNILNQSPSIKQLFESAPNDLNDIIYDMEQYDGILSRAHSKTHESGESSRSLYLFPNANITNMTRRSKKQNEHILLQSPTGNRGKLLNYMVYCGERWGIIGTGGALVPVLYQLKPQNIKDKYFKFTEISNEDNAEKVWGRHPGYQCKQYLMMSYMPDKDMLFAVQCKQEHGASVSQKPPSKQYMEAKCGLYHLKENRWEVLNGFRFSKFNSDDEDNFNCGLCYSQKAKKMYLVSSLGRTASYCFQLKCWKVLYENVANFNDQTMRYDMGPIVWSYEHTPHVLYCIGARKQNKSNKYTLQYKEFDVRSERRKWIDLLSKLRLKQIKDLHFKSIFV